MLQSQASQKCQTDSSDIYVVAAAKYAYALHSHIRRYFEYFAAQKILADVALTKQTIQLKYFEQISNALVKKGRIETNKIQHTNMRKCYNTVN